MLNEYMFQKDLHIRFVSCARTFSIQSKDPFH
jgi:hypothetical protein